MKALYQALLTLLASGLESDLAKQVLYLKAENEILRDKLPRRINVTPREREKLLKFGRPLGAAIKGLVTIVSPRTFLRWLAGEKEKPALEQNKGPGRPPTPADIETLILDMAKRTGWGYTRIHGELKKLGVKVSRTTVANILRAADIDPGPKRGEGTWSDFIARHARTFWACDFVSQKVLTCSGVVEVFLLFFIHVGSRRVHLAGVTANPDGAWVAQQARNLSLVFDAEKEKPTHLIRDLDSKFTAQFDAILASEGVEVVPVGPRSPNLNAFAERFVLPLRRECLDHFLFFGESHLRHCVSSYLAHSHEDRPHQGLGNRPLGQDESPEPSPLRLADVVCEERLGGLLKSYRRAA